ncbi:hypothetical protein QQS21_007550 [Conoideocrella luteorostrata]|uniref:Uncharacterized protein n=1 Tax=Conoideocrella luteorostrata TaxID=1105319 RepID=A0AAJ0CLC8_9HYPO|nr:hypothetical protein QQS21_007550 [Conoideocrella luteorostrata]
MYGMNILRGVTRNKKIKDAIVEPDLDYIVMLEDLALKYKLNVAAAHGFDTLEASRHDEANTKTYIDLWIIQMSAEVSAVDRVAMGDTTY